MDGSITRYRAFIRTVELGSLSAAAADMGFSQSAMSRMISALEQEWNVALLERSRAGVCLTGQGEALLAAARRIVEAQDEFASTVHGLEGATVGHVKIATMASFATHYLPKLICEFLQDHPQITYEILLGDYFEIDKWVEEGRADCAITRLPCSRSLDAVPFAQDEFLAVLPRGHRLAKCEKVEARDLLEERLFLVEKDGNQEVREVFAECGGVATPFFKTWNDHIIMAMVEAGLGVGILPSLILERCPYDIEIRPLAKPAIKTIGLVTRPAVKRSAAVRAFMDTLLEKFDAAQS